MIIYARFIHHTVYLLGVWFIISSNTFFETIFLPCLFLYTTFSLYPWLFHKEYRNFAESRTHTYQCYITLTIFPSFTIALHVCTLAQLALVEAKAGPSIEGLSARFTSRSWFALSDAKSPADRRKAKPRSGISGFRVTRCQSQRDNSS